MILLPSECRLVCRIFVSHLRRSAEESKFAALGKDA
jgi:hypothetical protein